MQTYDIRGVPVEFPYDAYACQVRGAKHGCGVCI